MLECDQDLIHMTFYCETKMKGDNFYQKDLILFSAGFRHGRDLPLLRASANQRSLFLLSGGGNRTGTVVSGSPLPHCNGASTSVNPALVLLEPRGVARGFGTLGKTDNLVSPLNITKWRPI